MEQIHNSQQMTDRLNCENDSCSDPRTHHCSDHDQVLCASCSTNFHQKCRATKIPDVKEVAYCLETTNSVLSSIRQDSKHFKTSSSTNNFDEELRMFTEKLSMINEKFANSVENNNSHELLSIMKEVVQLQKELIQSKLLAQSSKSAELRLALSRENLSRQMVGEEKKGASEITLIDSQRDFNEECLDRCELIQMQYAGSSEQVDKSKQEKHKHVISSKTCKEIKQRELNILKQERKIHEVVFSRIYHRHTGEKISITSNFYLKINTNEEKHKAFMRDCVASRLRLPDLNGIQINYISDADSDLASFLSDCTPARLQLLCFNFFVNSTTGIKSKFYVDAFSVAVARTIKEVYFFFIDFSAKDLQTIVRAACNSERIVFDWCCIHCSLGLDFGADLIYNTKFLSFQSCGNTFFKDWTTDWKADPSKFSLIVDAIGSSGLKASLEKLNIYHNDTLSASKVQEELNKKGMSHISVVQDWPCQLSS